MVGFALSCGPGVTTQVRDVPSVEEVHQTIEEMAASGYEPSQANGCRVKTLLKHLVAEPQSPAADAARMATLSIPAASVCWNAEACEESGPCDAYETAQERTEGLAALVQIHFGGYGFQEHLTRDPELIARFVEQFAHVLNSGQRVCDAAEVTCHSGEASDRGCEKARETCLAMQENIPGVVSLIDGMGVENFANKRKQCCPEVDDAAFLGLFRAYEEALKEHEVAASVPKAIDRAEAELRLLTATDEADGVTRERIKSERRVRDEARERARLRAELKRKLNELKDSMARARRAADIALSARRQLAVRQLASTRASSSEEDAEAEAAAKADALCRGESAPLFMGEQSVKAVLAEIHCLLAVADDYPSVVSGPDREKLNSLFLGLEETVIGMRLDGLRITPASLQEVSGLFATFDKMPLVTDSWKATMHSRVMHICTDYVDELVQGVYQDVLKADEWVKGCLAGDPKMLKKWTKRIAKRVKWARGEKAAEEARIQKEKDDAAAALAKANSKKTKLCNTHRDSGKNWRGCLDAIGAKCCQNYNKPDDCSYDSYEPGKSCMQVGYDICGLCYPKSY